jgi:hypothetical protein
VVGGVVWWWCGWWCGWSGQLSCVVVVGVVVVVGGWVVVVGWIVVVGGVVVVVGVVVGGAVWWCEWWCGQSFNALQPFSTSFNVHLLLVIRFPFLNRN